MNYSLNNKFSLPDFLFNRLKIKICLLLLIAEFDFVVMLFFLFIFIVIVWLFFCILHACFFEYHLIPIYLYWLHLWVTKILYFSPCPVTNVKFIDIDFCLYFQLISWVYTEIVCHTSRQMYTIEHIITVNMYLHENMNYQLCTYNIFG